MRNLRLVFSILLILLGLFQCTLSNTYLGLALMFFGALILFYCICAQLVVRFPKAIRCVRISITCIVCVGCVYFLAVESVIIKDGYSEPDTPADYIIVLGANVYGHDPSPALIDRIECTYEYLIAHPDCIAILSGGNETNQEITESECMFQHLTQRGIPSERLIMESDATSTEENFAFSFDILTALDDLENKVIGVVTSDYHLHRAIFLAKNQGLDIIGIPARTSTISTALNNYIREVFGMTYYYVFGVEAS